MGVGHAERLVEPGVQVRGERCLRPVAADGARHRVERHDVARALPDRAEVCIAQEPGRGELLGAFSGASPKRDRSMAAPLVTLIGQPSPNSA